MQILIFGNATLSNIVLYFLLLFNVHYEIIGFQQ